ncbi:hypothetical protein HAX54_018082 [Datura stramonium]|uniref:Uncharacterized protein n=1 Tax=Datura stramonium TaxID=4076 RepID=A0ABS8S3C3_DATST|nr:hypothetical protein [Datura stramonium]
MQAQGTQRGRKKTVPILTEETSESKLRRYENSGQGGSGGFRHIQMQHSQKILAISKSVVDQTNGTVKIVKDQQKQAQAIWDDVVQEERVKQGDEQKKEQQELLSEGTMLPKSSDKEGKRTNTGVSIDGGEEIGWITPQKAGRLQVENIQQVKESNTF